MEKDLSKEEILRPSEIKTMLKAEVPGLFKRLETCSNDECMGIIKAILMIVLNC